MFLDLLAELFGVDTETMTEWYKFATFLFTNGIAGGLAAVTLVIAVRQYLKNHFVDQIEFNVNYLVPAGDEVFTLQQRGAGIFPTADLTSANFIYRWRLRCAIARCDEENRFVCMKADKDMHSLQSLMQKALSSHFSDQWIQALPNLPQEETRLIALTFEIDKGIRHRMIKIIVTSAEQLEQIAELMTKYHDLESRVGFQQPHHSARLKSLMSLSELYKQEKNLPDDEQCILREVQIPASVE